MVFYCIHVTNYEDKHTSLGKHQYCECKPSVISIYKLTSKFSSLSYYFYITIYLQDQVVFVDVCR